MAARARKSRKKVIAGPVSRATPPLMFLPEQPRSFAYVEDEDEFEIPQIPTELARSGRELRLSAAFQPASSFDLMAPPAAGLATSPAG